MSKEKFYDFFDMDEEENNQIIEQNYAMERDYMDAIKKGNIGEVLALQKALAEGAGRVRSRNLNLEEMRCAFAVNRALSRIAAYEAGIPAPIIHKITTQESKKIGQAKSEEQMIDACQDMLKEFCEIIRENKNRNYSAMVQSVIFSINQYYKSDLSIKSIAEQLDVSESYMIAQFKKETGITPSVYLRGARLKAAEKLLVSTEDEIQAISSRVGIPDANYFVKLFKTKYGMTPRSYRKKYKI